jgi:sulfur carrier protein
MTGPHAIRVNGESVGWREETLDALLVRLEYPTDRRGLAIAVNGEVVRRAEWPTRPVARGDEIDIVGAVQGG